MTLKLFSLSHENGADLTGVAADLFDSSDSYLFLNDQLDEVRKKEIANQLSEYCKVSGLISQPTLLIPTSGTTSSQLKIVVLTKENFLNGARRANEFLKSQAEDKWMMSLPAHHVAGLSVLARAYLNKNQVYYWAKWQPEAFVNSLKELKISFCSLVPTQVYDLASKKFAAPRVLKKILIGGSAVADTLFQEMISLGWPLVKTYGMTETSAFMSYADFKTDLCSLPGVSIKLNEDGQIAIKCNSLFEGYIEQKSQWHFQPKLTTSDGFWVSDDRGQIIDSEIGKFTVLGRDQNMIKIKGELVNTQLLNSRFLEIASEFNLNPQSVMIHYLQDARNENELFLVYENSSNELEVQKAIIKFNSNVLPHERIRSRLPIMQIPRTELGKIKILNLSTDEFKKYFLQNQQLIK